MNYHENKARNIGSLTDERKESQSGQSEQTPKDLNTSITDHYDQDEKGSSQYDREEKHDIKPED